MHLRESRKELELALIASDSPIEIGVIRVARLGLSVALGSEATLDGSIRGEQLTARRVKHNSSTEFSFIGK